MSKDAAIDLSIHDMFIIMRGVSEIMYNHPNLKTREEASSLYGRLVNYFNPLEGNVILFTLQVKPGNPRSGDHIWSRKM